MPVLAHQLVNNIINHFQNKFNTEVPNSEVLVCYADNKALQEYTERPRLAVVYEGSEDGGEKARGKPAVTHNILLTLYYPIVETTTDMGEESQSMAHAIDWVDVIISEMTNTKFIDGTFSANFITCVMVGYSPTEVAYSAFFDIPAEISNKREFTDYSNVFTDATDNLYPDPRYPVPPVPFNSVYVDVESEGRDPETERIVIYEKQ